MATNPITKKVAAKDRYWNGVFTGVFIGCFFVSILLIIFIRFQGLRIAINPGKLAKLVQEKVQHEAERDIPQILQELKRELPAEVSSHLEGLDDLSIGFGKSQVKLPTEVISGIKLEFNRVIETAIINTLNDYDTSKYEGRIGSNAYSLIEKLLRQDIIGKTYLIETSKWFAVPIKIVGTNNHSLRVGI